MSDVTQILQQIESGDPSAAEQLLPLVYEELRKLAAAKLAQEKPGQTLQATALVNEAYLRLVGSEDPGWSGRGHFYAAAAEAMRRILVERGRQRGRLKHGGGRKREALDHVDLGAEDDVTDILALDEALRELEAADPRAAQIVMLRYFAGLTAEDTAKALDLGERTVRRTWSTARLWLYDRMSAGASDE